MDLFDLLSSDLLNFMKLYVHKCKTSTVGIPSKLHFINLKWSHGHCTFRLSNWRDTFIAFNKSNSMHKFTHLPKFLQPNISLVYSEPLWATKLVREPEWQPPYPMLHYPAESNSTWLPLPLFFWIYYPFTLLFELLRSIILSR